VTILTQFSGENVLSMLFIDSDINFTEPQRVFIKLDVSKILGIL